MKTGRLCGAAAAVAVCVAVAAAGDALAQPDPQPAAGGPDARALSFSRRVIRGFDFEERAAGNFETMPRYWYRSTGTGMPRYTEIGLDDRVRHSGQTSLRLGLDGGSAAAELGGGTVGVVPEGRYMVSAQVRTDRAVHARARVEAWYTDSRGERIESTHTSSSPLRSNGAWSKVELRLPDAPTDAGWLVVRLGLLQPDQYGPAPTDPHRLRLQDLHAAAWFDDVKIVQLPRIDLRTSSATNVILAPEPMVLDVSVHDLTGQDLTAIGRVYDHAGRVVATRERRLQVGRPGDWRWTLDGLTPGWYWVDLSIVGADRQTVAGRAWTAVTLLAPAAAGDHAEQSRFLILADDAGGESLDLAGRVLGRIGRHGVVLGVWGDRSAEFDADGDGFDGDIIRRLRDDDRRVVLAITGVPEALAAAAGVDAGAPLSLFARDQSTWGPRLEPTLARFAPYVRDWVVGATSSDDAVWYDNAGSILAGAEAYMGRFVGDSRLYVPWPVHGGDAPSSGSLMVLLSDSVQPARIGEQLSPLGDPAEMAVVIETLEPGVYPHTDRAADLALRVLGAWELGVGSVGVRHPWFAHDLNADEALPDALLPVWVTLSRQLAGRRVASRFAPAEGLEAMILSGDRGDAMAVWRSEPRGSGVLEVDGFAGATITDVWGRRAPVLSGRIEIGESPVFIENLDMRLMRFRASFAVEPGFMRSVFAEHDLEVVMTNPWPVRMNGRLRITGPQRWDATPSISVFAIGPGETVRLPLGLSFPINEVAGPKRLTARIEFETDRPYDLDLSAPIEVGLADLELESRVATEAAGNGEDVVITLRLTNFGREPRSFYAFALPPGQTQQQRIIANLEPRQTAVKVFRLSGAGASLSGRSIRAGIRQIDGPEILNHALMVP